ncbi:hypothetical protein WS70_03325 [Burkholderia mayonis]|uniref:Uncharacterized protein n=1 Tax=Burkholderia mayonis TaxID=1385591 RepID=A0A1B4FBF9_9BURK|nr:hypothetical protein WS70_03325 [Burkholderia mayonis]KVE49829.1 hypothetical protein WS70_18760 [Burkholderia mayonis]
MQLSAATRERMLARAGATAAARTVTRYAAAAAATAIAAAARLPASRAAAVAEAAVAKTAAAIAEAASAHVQPCAIVIARAEPTTKTARARCRARRYHRGIPNPVPTLGAPR